VVRRFVDGVGNHRSAGTAQDMPKPMPQMSERQSSPSSRTVGTERDHRGAPLSVVQTISTRPMMARAPGE
jgi:hypothetical protein